MSSPNTSSCMQEKQKTAKQLHRRPVSPGVTTAQPYAGVFIFSNDSIIVWRGRDGMEYRVTATYAGRCVGEPDCLTRGGVGKVVLLSAAIFALLNARNITFYVGAIVVHVAACRYKR